MNIFVHFARVMTISLDQMRVSCSRHVTTPSLMHAHTHIHTHLPSAKGAFTVSPLFMCLSLQVIHDDSFTLSPTHSLSVYLGHISSLMPILLLTPWRIILFLSPQSNSQPKDSHSSSTWPTAAPSFVILHLLFVTICYNNTNLQ